MTLTLTSPRAKPLWRSQDLVKYYLPTFPPSLNISEVPIGLLIMVFFFTSTVVDPPVTLFMGLDKHENEELIKWGWPEDVWFHVDKVKH